MLATILLVLIVMSWRPAAMQAPTAPSEDIRVYKAIIAHKIGPEVDRFSAGAGIPTPAALLTFDRTLMVCRPLAEHPRQMGCMRDEEIQSFETKLPRMQRALFEGLLNPESRAELASVFRERNREPQPFPGMKLDRVITTSPEGLDQAIEREAGRTRGFLSFSRPAYSTDGHALVYGSYVCGGRCGHGWFFLLKRRSEVWQVIAVDVLWIS